MPNRTTGQNLDRPTRLRYTITFILYHRCFCIAIAISAFCKIFFFLASQREDPTPHILWFRSFNRHIDVNTYNRKQLRITRIPPVFGDNKSYGRTKHFVRPYEIMLFMLFPIPSIFSEGRQRPAEMRPHYIAGLFDQDPDLSSPAFREFLDSDPYLE